MPRAHGEGLLQPGLLSLVLTKWASLGAAGWASAQVPFSGSLLFLSVSLHSSGSYLGSQSARYALYVLEFSWQVLPFTVPTARWVTLLQCCHGNVRGAFLSEQGPFP